MFTACRTEWLGNRQEGYGSTLLDLRTLEAFRSSSDAYSSQEPASQSYYHPVRIKWSRGQVAAGTRVWPLNLLTYSLWDVQTQLHSICGRDQQSVLTEPLSSSLLKLEEHRCRHPSEEADWGGIDSQGPQFLGDARGILCVMQARRDRFHSWGLSKDLHFRIHVFSFSQSPASELGDRLCLSNKRLSQKRSELSNSRPKLLSLPHYRTETFLWPLQRDLKAVVLDLNKMLSS